jgi:hypothetical protein
LQARRCIVISHAGCVGLSALSEDGKTAPPLRRTDEQNLFDKVRNMDKVSSNKLEMETTEHVIPAKAGIQEFSFWVPAFAGTTKKEEKRSWYRMSKEEEFHAGSFIL